MFEITIVETREVRKINGKKWDIVGQKEVEREERFYRDEGPKTRIEPIYGYTPEIEATITEKREALKQTVDDLDLPAVIRAINKL